MPADPAVSDLCQRLREADEDAAREVFGRFTHRLFALAQSQLQNGMRNKIDPEDVVQSVYRSFFVRQRAGQFSFDSWDSLWSILAVITLRKCGHKIEYFQAVRRDVSREQPLHSSGLGLHSSLFAHDPTPSEAAMLAEMAEQLMLGLDPNDRKAIELHLQGFTIAEISPQAGYSERTVRRTLERARRRLRRLQEQTEWGVESRS